MTYQYHDAIDNREARERADRRDILSAEPQCSCLDYMGDDTRCEAHHPTRGIVLARGEIATVDAEDFDKINSHKWYCSKGYAVRVTSRARGKIRRKIYMHREILGTPDGADTDHINMNRLDNRRANLRVCTRSQNMANSGIPSSNTSGLKGAVWNKWHGRWQAKVKDNGKDRWLGYFDTAEEAARAYRECATEIFGEFARHNLPVDPGCPIHGPDAKVVEIMRDFDISRDLAVEYLRNLEAEPCTCGPNPDSDACPSCGARADLEDSIEPF